MPTNENERIGKLIYSICKNLPEDYRVEVYLEKGSCCVKLTDPDGTYIESFQREPFFDRLEKSLKSAIEDGERRKRDSSD